MWPVRRAGSESAAGVAHKLGSGLPRVLWWYLLRWGLQDGGGLHVTDLPTPKRRTENEACFAGFMF